MKAAFVAIATCFAASIALAETQLERENEGQRFVVSQTHDFWLVIVGAERDFHSAEREARRVGAATKTTYSRNGNIWDAKRGLILPDNCNDPIYCGEYVLRRYNDLSRNGEDYISVEKSEVYPSLKPGFYIALAAIRSTRDEAEATLQKYKAAAPTSYVAKTHIYMGCMH